MSRIHSIVCIFALFLLPMASAPASAAATAAVQVKAGKMVTIRLPRNPRIIGVEDPSVATLEILAGGHARVLGKRAGKTRVIGRDFAELPIVIPVTVTP